MDTFVSFARHQRAERTSSQRQAVAALDEFLAADGQDRCFLLKGYAGTGKTHLIGLLARYLVSINRHFMLMAPTGRASRLISRRTGFKGLTVHKSIYALDKLLEHERDEEDFRYYFGLRNTADQETDLVFIVDEASMLGDKEGEGEFLRFGSGRLLADLLEYGRLKVPGLRTKIIFVGDNAQLLPVGDSTSPALDAGYLRKVHGVESKECELTDVVRQAAGNAIYQNATAIRDVLRSRLFNRLDLQLRSEEVEDITQDEPGQLARICLDSKTGRPSGDTLLVTYSNEEALRYNRLLRGKIHPSGELAPVRLHDRLIVQSNNAKYGLYNGDFVMVVEEPGPLEERTISLKSKPPVTLGFRDVVLAVRNDAGELIQMRCRLFESLLQSPERDISREEQIALYMDFKRRHPQLKPGTAAFSEALQTDDYFNALRVKYGYAITCHKAQGGEWAQVVVKFGRRRAWDNEEFFRWCYTALTRAKHTLYAIDPPHFKPWDGIFAEEGKTLIETVADPVATKGTPADDPPSVPAHREALKLFGWEQVDSGPSFLLEKFLGFRLVLKELGLEAASVEHLQYQERWWVRQGNAQVGLQVYYDGRGRFKSPQIAAKSDEVPALRQIVLDAFTRAAPVRLNPASGSAIAQLPMDQPHLQQCHELMVQRLQPLGIQVEKVECRDYALRFHVGRAGELAVYDVFFDAKGKGTTVQPLPSLGNSPTILDELKTVLTL